MKFSRNAAVLALLVSAMLSGCAGKDAEISGQSVSSSKADNSDAVGESSAQSVSSSQTDKSVTVEESPVISSAVSEDSTVSANETHDVTEITSEPNDPLLETLYNEIDESGCQVGIAFIGYVGSEASEEDMRAYIESSQYPEKYAFLTSAPIVDAGGTELYAVVTKADCGVTVCPAMPTESGLYDIQSDTVLYQGSGADCFLLRCNMSDIFSNVAVRFSSPIGDFYQFPMLSGMDGRLCAADGVYDFSFYPDDSGETDVDVRIATELLLEVYEVQERSQQGMTLLYTGQKQTIDGRECMIFSLGTIHESQFVSEYLYGVCDNLIYCYDAVSDSWNVIGAG